MLYEFYCKRLAFIAVLLWLVLNAYAQEKETRHYKSFQVPADKISCLDGNKAITPVGEAAMNADAKAFAALMKHMKDVDEQLQTVIMIQVQNEVGLLGDCRHRSEGCRVMAHVLCM
jgi:hypothetical protein